MWTANQAAAAAAEEGIVVEAVNAKNDLMENKLQRIAHFGKKLLFSYLGI